VKLRILLTILSVSLTICFRNWSISYRPIQRSFQLATERTKQVRPLCLKHRLLANAQYSRDVRKTRKFFSKYAHHVITKYAAKICGNRPRLHIRVNLTWYIFFGGGIAQSLARNFTAYQSLESTCIGLIGRKLYWRNTIQLIKVLWCVLRSLYVTDCWRPFLSSCRCVHLEQSSSIWILIKISANQITTKNI